MRIELEHPDITRMERFGYPYDSSDDEGLCCDICGDSLVGEDIYEDEDHSCLCATCLLNRHAKRWI